MVKSSQKVAIGIIGCGRVAHEHHLPALKLIPNVQVVAAANLDSHRVQHLADQYRIPHRYINYQDLIQNPNIEVVAVLTPTGAHAEIGLAVMDANKHLIHGKATGIDCCRVR